MVEFVTQYMDLILKFANICIIGYAALKFAKRPHDSLDERLAKLEDRIEKFETENDLRQKDIEQQLRQGNDKFRSHENIIEVLLTCTLALITFEVHYCETEQKPISPDLEEARRSLNKCLSKISKEDTI